MDRICKTCRQAIVPNGSNHSESDKGLWDHAFPGTDYELCERLGCINNAKPASAPQEKKP